MEHQRKPRQERTAQQHLHLSVFGVGGHGAAYRVLCYYKNIAMHVTVAGELGRWVAENFQEALNLLNAKCVKIFE